jgi:catechol 2,3-dioxygenase-like lactoylglutathione lyase family enzyme
MEISGVTHTGIIVKNLEEEMIPFLRDFLGLKQLSKAGSHPTYNADDARAVGVPGAILKACVFQVSPGHLLEVIEYVQPPSPIDAPLPQNAVGAHHVAFTVDDIQAWAAKLNAAGYRCYSEPQYNQGGIHDGIWWLYFAGPGGIVFELMEIPPGFSNF